MQKLSIPKSTMFKILATLEHGELIRKDVDSGKYQLGVKLIEWGGRARYRLEIRKLASPFMKHLNEKYNATVHLAIMANGMVLPIESVETENWFHQHFRYSPAVGMPAPLHCTAAGKAILAFLRRDICEEILREKGLPRYSDKTITEKREFIENLRQTVERGYAVSDGEYNDMIRSIAAPVHNQEGRVVASLSVLGSTATIIPEKIEAIGRDVVTAANELSRLSGYRS